MSRESVESSLDKHLKALAHDIQPAYNRSQSIETEAIIMALQTCTAAIIDAMFALSR